MQTVCTNYSAYYKHVGSVVHHNFDIYICNLIFIIFFIIYLPYYILFILDNIIVDYSVHDYTSCIYSRLYSVHDYTSCIFHIYVVEDAVVL